MEDSLNLFLRESRSDSSFLVSSLNDFLEDNEDINMPLESSMEPRPDPVSGLFNKIIMNLGNISSIIQDLVCIPDDSLEVDQDWMKFIQNSNLGKLDL